MPAYLSKYLESGQPVLMRQLRRAPEAISEAEEWVKQPGRTARVFMGKNSKLSATFAVYGKPPPGMERPADGSW